jgi:hypothetical protein
LGSTRKLVSNPGKVEGWQFVEPKTLDDLKVGDIFYRDNRLKNKNGYYSNFNHVVIYLGKDENGKGMTMESTRQNNNPHRDTVYLIKEGKEGGIFLDHDKNKIGTTDEGIKIYDKIIRITNVFIN